MIRPLNDRTRHVQSVVADLQPLGSGYVGVTDERIGNALPFGCNFEGGLFDPPVWGTGEDGVADGPILQPAHGFLLAPH